MSGTAGFKSAGVVPGLTRLTTVQHIYLASFWFALNFHWGGLLPVVLPVEILRFVPEDQKGTYMGLVTGVGAIVAAVAAPIAGAFSDRSTHRLGRRTPYIIQGSLLNALALLLMALSPALLPFACFFVIVQLANNWASGPYAGLIPDMVPPDQRGIASGWMGLMTMLGTILAAGLAGPVLDHGLRVPYYGLLALVMLAGAGLTRWKVREQPLGEAPPFQLGPFLRSFWISPRQYPDFLWVWITRFMVMMGFYTILPFLAYYLRDAIGLANYATAASVVAGAVLVGATLSTLVSGWLSDRVGRKPIVCLSGLTMGLTAVAFVFTQSYLFVLLFAVIFGLGYGAYTAVDWALAVDVLPSEQAAAKDLGIWGVAIVLPQILAATTGGLLLDGFNRLQPNLGYQVIFALACLYTVLGSIWVWNIRGTR